MIYAKKLNKLSTLVAATLALGSLNAVAFESELISKDVEKLQIGELISVKGELNAPSDKLLETVVLETGQVITFEDRDGRAIIQGDIDLGSTVDVLRGISLGGPDNDRQLDSSDVSPDGVVIPHAGYRWPNNTVPYTLDSSLSSTVRNQITYAMNHWTTNTSVRFVPRTNQTNYVHFQPRDGICSSRVGMVNEGRQSINLDTAGRCGNGATIHEIAHAVGIWHEQSRNDRDNFVTIDFNNVPENRRHNFSKVGQFAGQGDDGVDTGSYDFGSIMHYSAYAFAIDRSKPTIIPKDSSIPLSSLGQRNGLSAGDLAAVAFMYGAPSQGGSQLTNGTAKTNLSGAKDSQKTFTMDVPAGASNLSFKLSGGTGDADLHVKFGSAATKSSYDCRPYETGNNETCTISNVQTGTYHVMLNGYASYSGASLVGAYTASGGGSQTHFENNSDFNIPDNNSSGVRSPINVSRSGNAGTISVKVNIVHTYIGDLSVVLEAPNGNKFTLHNRSGGSADNINKTYSVNAGSIPSNGTWNLHVTDRAGQDVGRIDSWSMDF